MRDPVCCPDPAQKLTSWAFQRGTRADTNSISKFYLNQTDIATHRSGRNNLSSSLFWIRKQDCTAQMYRDDKPTPLEQQVYCVMTNSVIASAAPYAECKLSRDAGDRQTDGQRQYLKRPPTTW